MKTRAIIGAVGVLLLMAATSPSVAAKDATVTLAVSGMTTQRLVDQVLMTSASRIIDLLAEPVQNIIIQPGS